MNVSFLKFLNKLPTRTFFLIRTKKLRRKTNSMAYSRNAVVRCQADDTKIQLSFLYGNELLEERIFNFNRAKDEHVGILFGRIQKNIETVCNKKRKNKTKTVSGEGGSAQEKLVVKLQDETSSLLPEDTQNVDAWKSGYLLTVGEKLFTVTVNAPTVKSVSLPKHIMAGFPVYPKIELEFTTKEEAIYEWYKTLRRDEVSKDACGMTTHWQKTGTGYYYMTKPSDVGRNLKVTCEPRSGPRTGLKVEAVSLNTVSAGPGVCPFDERHLYTEEISPKNSFRVVSYNILADLYADSEHTRTVLYPYCPAYALDADYRKQLLIKEILGYHGDLVCLQEVDSKLFRHDLRPLLLSVGMEGEFLEKGGQVVEGLACFVNRSKFRILESEGIILAEQLPTNPIFTDIYNKICENEKLKERVLARTTALQVVVIESVEKPGSVIIVGNTHLYFHPDADHIRLLQGTICIRYLENKLQRYRQQWPEKSVSVMWCGDFNSCPENGVYQLMTTGSVPHTSADWHSAPEEIVTDLTVSQDLDFQSACGTPAYTNYTEGFIGCLDYIFYQPSHLNLNSSVPFPSHEQVIQHVALPSVVFPSDHLALIATLDWKS